MPHELPHVDAFGHPLLLQKDLNGLSLLGHKDQEVDDAAFVAALDEIDHSLSQRDGRQDEVDSVMSHSHDVLKYTLKSYFTGWACWI